MSLARSFVTHLAAARRRDASEVDDLEDRLAEMLESARRAWNEVTVNADAFIGYLAERVPADASVDQSLRAVHADDLYLACACASGDAAAVAAFARAHQVVIDASIARMGAAQSVADEVKQRLWDKLFVARGDGVPKIATYSGRGDLRSWVRAAAVREAITMLRAQRKEVPVDGAILGAMSAGDDDPELAHLKDLYRAEFKVAFETSFAALSARDRTLLRYKFVDGASIDELATIYRVHRATAARWIADIRERLLLDTRAHMMRELGVQPGEVDSIIKLIQSRLDVSISGQLR